VPVNNTALLVAAGYDALGPAYGAWAADIPDDTSGAWMERLEDDLPAAARILDLGCGPGVPIARRFAGRFNVTGVDISGRQIDLARAAVPSARFLLADMAAVEFAPDSFEAVVALFSLIHLRRRDLDHVLRRAHHWLVPGGRMLATFGTVDDEGVQDSWLGVPMFFGTTSPEQTRALLAASGFEVLAEDVVTTTEPGQGEVSFHWVDARALA